MKSEIDRWVNSLTPLELAVYGVDREEINRWLDVVHQKKSKPRDLNPKNLPTVTFTNNGVK